MHCQLLSVMFIRFCVLSVCITKGTGETYITHKHIHIQIRCAVYVSGSWQTESEFSANFIHSFHFVLGFTFKTLLFDFLPHYRMIMSTGGQSMNKSRSVISMTFFLSLPTGHYWAETIQIHTLYDSHTEVVDKRRFLCFTFSFSALIRNRLWISTLLLTF